MRHALPVFLAAALLAGCAGDETTTADAGRVERIASDFVDAYFAHHPEEAFESGYPGAPTDRFGDFRPESIAAFDAKVDAFLADLDAIDVTALEGTPAAQTYRFARERLEALAGLRVCRYALWNVSPTWTGWQSMMAGTLAAQPVGTAAERDAALARASDIDRYLDVEIANLDRGRELGYLAPQSNVRAVLDQLDTLIAAEPGASPFFSPALRSEDTGFRDAYREVYEAEIVPALAGFREFLGERYEGRETIGVAANPDGEACYDASVRFWSSLSMPPAEIHRIGLSEMSRIRSEMLEIAREEFGTDDLGALLDALRTDPRYTFASEEQMLDYIRAAVDRARVAMDDWFAQVPDAELVIRPSPAFEKDSGGGFYASGAPDGSRPAVYQVGTHDPQSITRAGQEATAFHESWPGHHLQGSIAILNESLHPIQRYMYIAGSGEGWGLYAERLADEIGLYSDAVARIGMLSQEAFRAGRLVVDTGMHVMGWSREDAIAYMLENTADGRGAIAAEIDRYAAVPGQATSYMLGSLEILRLRRHAETALGEDFDIREFHHRLLSSGSVTLPMLESNITAWIEERQ